MIRRPPRSTHCISSAASDVYKRQIMHKNMLSSRDCDAFLRKSKELEAIKNRVATWCAPKQDRIDTYKDISLKEVLESVNTLKFEKAVVDMNFTELRLSKIVKGKVDMKMLFQWMQEYSKFKPSFSLLYRGSTNDFNGANFFVSCNNTAPTLILVQTTTGNIFGEYTIYHWRKGAVSSQRAGFVFSLVNKTRDIKPPGIDYTINGFPVFSSDKSKGLKCISGACMEGLCFDIKERFTGPGEVVAREVELYGVAKAHAKSSLYCMDLKSECV
eukprot:TRINITY_DN6264_c0_g3_i1.p1 TRINITY_DN6264_c0_g3~~TRINITY_DN6264_c0_g3_i1.p1  ORF type:complete len:279 (+),score=58.78 TRINITY_DN6264_c0_g3_i1:25-837(+)